MSRMGDNIANAIIPEGLSPNDLGDFILAVTSHNSTALASVPGLTPEVAQAGTVAMLNTYVQGFQHVWTAAACFVALASVGRFIQPPLSVRPLCQDTANGVSSRGFPP